MNLKNRFFALCLSTLFGVAANSTANADNYLLCIASSLMHCSKCGKEIGNKNGTFETVTKSCYAIPKSELNLPTRRTLCIGDNSCTDDCIMIDMFNNVKQFVPKYNESQVRNLVNNQDFVKKYPKIVFIGKPDNDFKCPICLCYLSDFRVPYYFCICGKLFHQDCGMKCNLCGDKSPCCNSPKKLELMDYSNISCSQINDHIRGSLENLIKLHDYVNKK